MATKLAANNKRNGVSKASSASSTETVGGHSSASGQSLAGGHSSPLYQQIARVLKEEIVSGVYPVGTLLPTEDGLCERFSVSRYTIREALRRLREDGLVASRQGAGTEVIPPHASDSDIQQVMSINDLVAYVTDTRLEIESIRTVLIDKKLSARTGLPIGEEWLEIRGFRLSETLDCSLCWAEYYVNREYAAVARLLQRHSGPIFPLIEDMFGVSINVVDQQISASLITPRLAAELNVDAGSAALEVRRTYKTAFDRIVQVTINIHPASRFQHSMTMRRVKA